MTRELLLVGLVILLLLGGCAATHNMVVSEGTRDGVVQKFGTSNWPWKTGEGQLAQDGWRGEAGNTFRFSCGDPHVAAEFDRLPPGRTVRVKYVRYWWRFPWEGATAYEVVGVGVK